MPGPLVSFEGVGRQHLLSVSPPTPNAAVGPNNVAQWVNIAFQIWDKDGNDPDGRPGRGQRLLAGLRRRVPGLQQRRSDRPVRPARRPLDVGAADVRIFGVDATTSASRCRRRGDPLGTYYLYDFLYSDTDSNDYPKIGVWPDAYYMTVRNSRRRASRWRSRRSIATAMLSGRRSHGRLRRSRTTGASTACCPRTWTARRLPGGSGRTRVGGAAGSLARARRHGSSGLRMARRLRGIHFYYFHPDFATPANSTFTGSGRRRRRSDYNPCRSSSTRPQPPPGVPLEANGWIQYRLPYRNFGDHESLVIEHDVFDDGGRVVPRWYEVRDPLGSPTVFQQGTYAPDDGVAPLDGLARRWTPTATSRSAISVADDTSTNPGIRWAGRLANDPPGDLTQGEAELVRRRRARSAGSAGATTARWRSTRSTSARSGTRRCTRRPAEGGDWSTRIGSFKFPSCSLGPTGTLEGTVTDGTNPIAGVEGHGRAWQQRRPTPRVTTRSRCRSAPTT